MKTRYYPTNGFYGHLGVPDVDAQVPECAGNEVPFHLRLALEGDLVHLPFHGNNKFSIHVKDIRSKSLSEDTVANLGLTTHSSVTIYIFQRAETFSNCNFDYSSLVISGGG